MIRYVDSSESKERCHVCPLRIRPMQFEAGVETFRVAASFLSPGTISRLRSKFGETEEAKGQPIMIALEVGIFPGFPWDTGFRRIPGIQETINLLVT